MTTVTHARDLALKLVEKVPDGNIRVLVERSLQQGANMNLMVKAFHKLYGLPIVEPWEAKEDFTHISKERLAMRFGLIVEEFKELCEAMDLECKFTFGYLDEEEEKVWTEDVTEAIENTDERCLPDIADATFDLKYVIIGFEYETGIEPQFCAEEGQASNMSKLDSDGTVIYREDGKVLKGPHFFRPDMARALRSWGMRNV